MSRDVNHGLKNNDSIASDNLIIFTPMKEELLHLTIYFTGLYSSTVSGAVLDRGELRLEFVHMMMTKEQPFSSRFMVIRNTFLQSAKTVESK